jgi:hypothetical protein
MEWNIWWWKRCRAALEKKDDSPYFGRCELNRKHKGWHAIERGYDTIEFATTLWDFQTKY